MLLSVIPYVVGLALFYESYQAQFGHRREPSDPQWRWAMSRPVLVSGLAPLAAATAGDEVDGLRVWLLSAAGVGILATVLIQALLKPESYTRMFLPIAAWKVELRVAWHVALFTAGVLVIGYAAAVNLWAAQAK